MRALRELLGLEPERGPDPDRDTATVRRIAGELDRLDPNEARYLAAFAYVLARVAYADLEVSDVEVDEMERQVREASELSSAQSALVVQIARIQAVTHGGTEDYVVTRQFRDLSTREQRLGLIRCLFAVAAADDSITQVENVQISQIATELGLTGREVAVIRTSYRDQLETLRQERRSRS
jgi:uncharacterized tellurite resistance protein B-like protein